MKVAPRATEHPTVATVATIYNNPSADSVSAYGARVQQIYESQPWVNYSGLPTKDPALSYPSWREKEEGE